MNEQSKSSRCSIAPHAPDLPPEAIEFAEAVGRLCDQFNIRKLEMKVEADRFSKTGQYRDDIVSDLTIHVSKTDGRGRPRTQIYAMANIHVSVPIVWEPSSTD